MYFEDENYLIPFASIDVLTFRDNWIEVDTQSTVVKVKDKARFLKEYKAWMANKELVSVMRNEKVVPQPYPVPVYPHYPQYPDPWGPRWTFTATSVSSADSKGSIKTTP